MDKAHGEDVRAVCLLCVALQFDIVLAEFRYASEAAVRVARLNVSFRHEADIGKPGSEVERV